MVVVRRLFSPILRLGPGFAAEPRCDEGCARGQRLRIASGNASERARRAAAVRVPCVGAGRATETAVTVLVVAALFAGIGLATLLVTRIARIIAAYREGRRG